jgi:hypothetical protein
VTGRHRIDRHAVGLFIGLDLVTYALVYWLAVPAVTQVLATLDATTLVATGHVMTAVRLTFIGAVVTRSIRSRLGFDDRKLVMPTIAVAALSAALVQTALGIAGALMIGSPAVTWAMLLGLVEWVGFGLLGALFVNPGEPDVVPLRFRRAAARETGSVTLFLVPAIAGLLFVTLAAILVIGSATNDRRATTTAADAAALAAVGEWRDSLKVSFLGHAGQVDPGLFWALKDVPLLNPALRRQMLEQAQSYAEKNDATLVDFQIEADRGRVSVTVRADNPVPGSTGKVESASTASIEFGSGLCRSGNVLGYLFGGTCHTAPDPTPPPSPTPTGPDGGDPAPASTFEPPAGLGDFTMNVAIVG